MAIRAQGTTLKFTPKGKTQVTVGMLRSVGEIAPDSEEIDVTTLDSTGGYREYMQGWRDAGTIAVNGFFDSGNAGQISFRREKRGAGGVFSCAVQLLFRQYPDSDPEPVADCFERSFRVFQISARSRMKQRSLFQ